MNDEIIDGMILSNEPGFYKKNNYGIRIENLVIAYKKTNKKLAFETISWAPIDIDLINENLLTSEEIKWLNNYHKKVYQIIKKDLNSFECQWLAKVTKPLKKISK